jgi:hypothetical protein
MPRAKKVVRDTGIDPDGPLVNYGAAGEDRPLAWGPFGDHTLCALVNDLRVCERLARPRRATHERRPGKTCYRYFLGVKWSQVQILSARQSKCPLTCNDRFVDNATAWRSAPFWNHTDIYAYMDHACRRVKGDEPAAGAPAVAPRGPPPRFIGANESYEFGMGAPRWADLVPRATTPGL